MRRSVYLILAMILFGSCGRGEQMRQQLERLEQDNRNDSVMQNDSLAESLVDYFDHHGTANERMRANYILGRTYFDLGELPRALETYYKAIDCADTTSTDCDFKTLSRIHAQTAMVFQKQVQPRSQLKELREAQYFANMANDSMMVLECYAQESYAYQILHKVDSVIQIKETAAACFAKFNQERRSAQTLGGVITSLIDLGNYQKAKQYINIYEASSGFFDESGNIRRGREIYYYAKGRFYLAINKLDSAELLFRRLLSDSLGLNCNIAGSKGLQQVFSKRNLSDSIAKYANLSYELNDSAYSLSEMENIQKFQASYNYNHNQFLTEQQKRKTNRAYLIIAIIVASVIISFLISCYLFVEYRKKENNKWIQYRQNLQELERTQTELMQLRSMERLEAEALIKAKNRDLSVLQKKIAVQQDILEARTASLESRLDNSDIAKHLRFLLKQNPPQTATQEDFKSLRQFAIEVIPTFYSVLNTPNCSLRPIEYDVCLLIRFHFLPAEICKLTGRSDSYIANLRKSILMKVFSVKGSPKDLDKRVLQIK